MKVSIYARESSDDKKKAPPITRQIERFKQWVQENGHELVHVFSDDGFSGGDWKRPAWNKSIREAKRHSYVVLWVWDQDRLARDTEQFLFYYRHMTAAHVRIFEASSNDYIDMETLGGRVKHQSIAQAAEIFRLVTSDKVKRVYQGKLDKDGNFKDGERWGRKPKKWDTELARKLRAEGKGWRAIALEVGVSYQTVRRELMRDEL